MVKAASNPARATARLASLGVAAERVGEESGWFAEDRGEPLHRLGDVGVGLLLVELAEVQMAVPMAFEATPADWISSSSGSLMIGKGLASESNSSQRFWSPIHFVGTKHVAGKP